MVRSLPFSPQTGELLAMVGGIDFREKDAGQVNLATSLRQPGSSFKPILYATALTEDMISPATVIWDTPTAFTVGMGHVYAPRNYDRKFHGPVTVRTALANSYNVPAVKLLASLGNEHLVAKAKDFGITSFTREPNSYGLSLSLGAAEVTLLELTNAFRTFANQGLYSPPQFALFMVDDLGRYRSTPAVKQEKDRFAGCRLSDSRHIERLRGAQTRVRAKQLVESQSTGRRENRYDHKL